MKKCFGTGDPSINENSGSNGEACVRMCKYLRSVAQGQIVGLFAFLDNCKVVVVDFECL